ncbi:MAG: hypothetical protein WDN03_13360 [Rhizomicrobium sp.]
MTKMELAIAKLRALPPERQEELAEYVCELAEEQAPYRLTDEQLAEVELAKKEVSEGKIASQEKMDALWRRAGLMR